MSCFLGTSSFSVSVQSAEIYRFREVSVAFQRPVGGGFDTDLIVLTNRTASNRDGFLDYQYAIGTRSNNTDIGVAILTAPMTGTDFVFRLVK